MLEMDSLALKVAARLEGKVKGIEFKAVESLDEVGEKRNLCIMDVAFGIEKVQLIQGIEKLRTAQPLSGHDFDLAMELKTLQKVGKLQGVKIIAIPAGFSPGKTVAAVRRLLKDMQQKAKKR